jgi:hypothetical protein
MDRTSQLGTFEIKSGSVYVTDPCYEIDTWCQGKVDDVLNGTWVSEADISNAAGWGNRVHILRVYHKEHGDDYSNLQEEKFEVGVDSGQAGFFDADLYPGKDDDFYDEVCNLTLSDKQGGCISFGTASSSGFGDGGYSCYTGKNKDGKVVYMEIVFIGDDDVEDESEEEDNDEEE